MHLYRRGREFPASLALRARPLTKQITKRREAPKGAPRLDQ